MSSPNVPRLCSHQSYPDPDPRYLCGSSHGSPDERENHPLVHLRGVGPFRDTLPPFLCVSETSRFQSRVEGRDSTGSVGSTDPCSFVKWRVEESTAETLWVSWRHRPKSFGYRPSGPKTRVVHHLYTIVATSPLDGVGEWAKSRLRRRRKSRRF